MKRRWSTGVLVAIVVAICVATGQTQPQTVRQAGAEPAIQVALSLSPLSVAVRSSAGLSVEIRI